MENDRSTEHTSASGDSRRKGRELLWARLETLVARVEREPGRGLVRMSAEEIGELSRLYRVAATHLAQAETFGASARLRERLHHLVARAHAIVYGRPSRSLGLRSILRSFVVFPAVVRRTWIYHATAAALLLSGALFGYFGATADPEWALEIVPAQDTRTPFADREELRKTLLSGRESQITEGAGEKAAFAAFLWTHNVQVALVGFFAGALFCIPTVVLVLLNGAMLGVYTATFQGHGLAFEWWAWILPHGVTELLAVTLLSGGGLLVGATILAPGTHGRVEALARIRGSATHLVLFAFPMLLLAAVFESFVRQSNLPDWGRYVFAAATAIGWTLYLGCVGPTQAGEQAEANRISVAEARIPVPERDELR